MSEPAPERQDRTTDRTLDALSQRFLGGRGQPAAESLPPYDLLALRAAARSLAERPAEPAEALEAALAALMQAAAAGAARLYLLNEDGLLKMRSGRSRWENLPFLALVLRLEGGTLARAVRSSQPVLMRESFEVQGPPELAAKDEVCCLVLPLSARARTRGAVLLFRGEPFPQAQVNALGEAAPGLALLCDYLELAGASG